MLLLENLQNNIELSKFFTKTLLENDVGVIIDSKMPESSYITIDVDKYYHFILPNPNTPAIVDLILVAQKLSDKTIHNIYIIEMKNISSPRGFSVKNIYEKFSTAIEDFLKKRFNNIFLDEKNKINVFKLYFISDAYGLKKKGFSEEQIRSFLLDTKIMRFQALPVFQFREHKAVIEYELPNPLLEWN